MGTAAPAATAEVHEGVRKSVTSERVTRRSTPSLFRALSIILIVLFVVLALVLAATMASRRAAARTIRLQAEPVLMSAQDLYVTLANIDAAASRSFLTSGGAEPAELRQQYLALLEDAGADLTSMASMAGTSETMTASIKAIVQQLSKYTAHVDSARANNRLGYPVGAAYLHAASNLMRTKILVEATKIYDEAADKLDSAGRRGTSPTQVVLLTVFGSLTVLAIVVVGFVVARRTRRILNVGLLVAATITAVICVACGVIFVAQQQALTRGQRQGSDVVQTLAATRILLVRAHTDANAALIERGTGAEYVDDFGEVRRRLLGTEGRGGLLAEAQRAADTAGVGAGVHSIISEVQSYLDVASDVRQRDDAGAYDDAVELYLVRASDIEHNIDSGLDTAISDAQSTFADAASDAQRGVDVVAIPAILLLIVGAALAALGIQKRIGEYR